MIGRGYALMDYKLWNKIENVRQTYDVVHYTSTYCAVPVNSSLLGAAYMRQWTRSALVQIMACCLFGAKPLFEPMLVYSIVYSDADQRKHQSSASLAVVRGIHRGPVIGVYFSKWPVRPHAISRWFEIWSTDDSIWIKGHNRAWVNNCIPMVTVGHNYLYMMCSQLNFVNEGAILLTYIGWIRIHRHGYIDGLVQGCSNPIATAMELLQFCTKPSIRGCNY